MSALEDWLMDGGHLPPPLRDFHDQKDLFKALHEVLENSRASGRGHPDISWVDAQIYTIDIFLWCLARRGYTLQRSRKRGVEFLDLHDFIKAASDRRRSVPLPFSPPNPASGTKE